MPEQLRPEPSISVKPPPSFLIPHSSEAFIPNQRTARPKGLTLNPLPRFFYFTSSVVVVTTVAFSNPVTVSPEDGERTTCSFSAAVLHSSRDPIWILLALPEKKMIRIMAKQELRRVPFIGWVMEKFRVIFVNRGAHDIAAFSQCVDALAREQEKLLVFVEGTRCNREKHVRAKTGAVRMAAQAGVPVVPVFVTRNKTPFCPVSVVFGTPYRVGALDPAGVRPAPENDL